MSSPTEPPKPPGCDKNVDGDQLAALKGLTSDEMKTLINSHAGESCKNEISNSLSTAVARGTSMAAWLKDSATVSGSAGWSGGSASAGVSLDMGASASSTNTSTEDMASSGLSEGCRQTLFNMNDTNSLYSSLSCNMKSASNIIASQVRLGATVSVRAGPTDAMVAAQERKILGLQATIAAFSAREITTPASERSFARLLDSLDKAEAGFRFDIRNSTFKVTNNNIENLIATNNQEIDDVTKVKEAITKKAVAEAVADITQKYEMGAQASSSLESYATSKVNDSSLTTAQDIIAAANSTKIKVEMDGNLTFDIAGSIDGINVDFTQCNLVELRSELIMKAATELGKDIAAKIEQETMTKTHLEIEGTGLASWQKAIADGLAAQAKALEPPSMFGGLFGGLFGMLGMGGIAVLIGLFVLYKFTGLGFKIGLIVALIFGVYLAVAYFINLWPFTKEKNETDTTQLYDYIMTNLIVPRRMALFGNLFDTITTEKNWLMSLENGSQDYLDQLNSAQDWIRVNANKSFLLTRLSWRHPGPPDWVTAAIYNLERDTYDVIVNMLADVTNNNGDVFRNRPSPIPVIPRLKQERDELLSYFRMYRLDSINSDKQDAAYVNALRAVNPNPPRIWKDIFSEYQGWLERGKPSIQNRNVSVNSGVDSQTNPYAMASAGTQRGYPVAQQSYPVSQEEIQWAVGYGPSQLPPGQAYISGYVQAQPQISTITQAQPTQAQPIQKSYTNPDKKQDMYSMQKKQNVYENTKAISKKGYEMRVAQMVQGEYSRKSRDSVKPVYNKLSVFKK